MKRMILRTFIALLVLYSCCCGFMYLFQESFIFHPKPIDKAQKIKLTTRDIELSIKTYDGLYISAILCKSNVQKRKKKLVFYLHGNTGNLLDQKEAAAFYLSLGFDFFSMDYRSFGKSDGEPMDQQTFFNDVCMAYAFISKQYAEKNIIVIGYSLGTASAAMLAATNKPDRLILLAPYYSLFDMSRRNYPWLPTFVLKYPFETYKFMQKITKTPILVAHGDKDEMVPFTCGLALSKLLNKKSKFLRLKGQTHNFFERNTDFTRALKAFLGP